MRTGSQDQYRVRKMVKNKFSRSLMLYFARESVDRLCKASMD